MAGSASDDRLLISDDKSFKNEISRLSGQNVTSCYQCGECTGGCPVAYAADLTPNQVIRMVQLGQDKEVLKSSMIWLCVGCETCGTRCPRGVELSKVMDALRQTAVAQGVPAGDPAIKTFHDTFLAWVERGGRMFEIGMIGEYKVRSLNLFSDLMLGARMFLKGKLDLIPKAISGIGDIKRIFRKTKKA